MPAEYALLTTERQAAADESNGQERSHFSPIQTTFMTFGRAPCKLNENANEQPVNQTLQQLPLGIHALLSS